MLPQYILPQADRKSSSDSCSLYSSPSSKGGAKNEETRREEARARQDKIHPLGAVYIRLWWAPDAS
jgi:hypothetical protein